MQWQPAATLATLRRRAQLLAATRAFFAERDVLEVETPALVAHAVTDPQVQNIPVRLADRELFLHTSPEFHMKRLLAAGAPDIWQLCKVFREGEAGRHHEPEFTMVEWYRHGFSLEQMAAEACELLRTLASAAETAGAAPLPGASPPAWLSYQDLFHSLLAIDPLSAGIGELRACARKELGDGLTPELAAGLGDEPTLWLDLLMSCAVRRHLAGHEMVVVTGYPAAQAALARLDRADPRLAERFEIFCRGVEVANGYRELTDAGEQRRRFAVDRAFRARMGRRDAVPDPRLLAALDAGLPDCSGVALGFDRVLMLLLGLGTLQEAISFPVLEH